MPSRDLKVTLVGSNETGKAFGSASKDADGLGAKFAKFGGIAAAGMGAAAVGIGLFAKSGVDAFARVEDATGVAGVTFGKNAAVIEKFAQGAAANFGISTGAALEAANTFGGVGKAAGLSGSDLAAFSQKFTGLAGDLSSFKGTSPEQAIEAIGSAMRGETEPIRAFGVAIDDAALRNEALAQGLIKTTKDALSPQNKALAAAALIFKQTGDAQGDFGKTSESTANTAKRLAAETENASAKLGQQLAPAVTVAREAFLGLIQGASGLVTKIGPWMATAQEAVTAFGKDALPVVKAAFQSVIDTLKSVGDAVMGVVNFFREHDTAAKALGAVVAAVAAGVAAAWVAQGVVATVNAAKNVLAWFTTATASTTSATIQSRSTAQIVVGWLAAGAGAVASVAKQVAAWVLLGAQALLNAAKVAAAWLISLGPIALVIAAVVGLVAVVIKNWDTIKNAITSAATAVLDFLKQNWPLILAILTGPIGLAVLAIAKNWDTIKAGIQAFKDKVGSIFSGMWDGLKDGFRSAVNFILRAWNSLDFKIPGFDPPGPGPKFDGFSLGVPNIPLLAKGGMIGRSGSAIVGDAGPELLDLPRGARVTPLSQAGGGVTVIVNGSVTAERDLVTAIEDGLAQKVRRNGSLAFMPA